MKRISVSVLKRSRSNRLILLLLLLLSQYFCMQLFRTPQDLIHPCVFHQVLLLDQTQFREDLNLGLFNVKLVGHDEEKGQRRYFSLVLGVVGLEFFEVCSFFAFLDVVGLQFACYLSNVFEAVEKLLLLQISNETVGLEIRHRSLTFPCRCPVMHLASLYIRRHGNVLVSWLGFEGFVVGTRLICISNREGNQAIGADIGRLQLHQRGILVVIQRQDSLLIEDYIFLGKLDLVFVVLHLLHNQIIEELVLLYVIRQLRSLGQGKRKLPRQQQFSLRRLSNLLRDILGEGSLIKFLLDTLSLNHADAFQLLKLGVELFVAHQEPLRKLSQAFETIGEIIDSIEDFLVGLDLGLSLDDFLIDLGRYSRVDAFELQIDIFFDDLSILSILFLLPFQLQDLQGHFFPQRNDFVITIGQVKLLLDGDCFIQVDDSVSEIGMWPERSAGFTDNVLAGVAVIGDRDVWMEHAEMRHIVTIELQKKWRNRY